MAEITNELIYKLMLEIQTEQKATRADMQGIHAELATMREDFARNVAAIGRTLRTIERDITGLKDRVTILSVAVDEGPHTHA
jgi:hypothetical protein